MPDKAQQVIEVKISDLIQFCEDLDNETIDYEWRHNKTAYLQYWQEALKLKTFTPEQWFEERQSMGWPQAIARDYLKWQTQLKESAVNLELASLKEALAQQSALISQLLEGQAVHRVDSSVSETVPTDTQADDTGDTQPVPPTED